MASKHQITVMVRIVAQAAKVELLKQALSDLATQARTESGCIKYDLHQSMKDPAQIIIYQNWRDQKALEEHTCQHYYRLFRDRERELIAEPMQVMHYHPFD